MRKKKNDEPCGEMKTLQEQLSSPKVQEVVVEEITPPIRSIEKTPDKVLEKKQGYIASIPEHMAELVTRIRAIRASSQEEREIRSKEEQNIVAEISSHLGYKDDLLRNRAAHAYADAIIAALPSEPEMSDIKKVLFGDSDLPGLLKLGMVTETDKKGEKPAVKFSGRKFQFNGGQGSKRAYTLKMAIQRARESEVIKIKAKGKMTKEELLAEKSGLVFLDVPNEVVKHGNSEDGKKVWYGGALLVVSNGKIVKAAEFAGGFESIMAEINEADVFIQVRQLFFERLQLPDLSPEKFRLCRIFHSILRRGLAAELARQKSAAPAGTAKIVSIADIQSAASNS